MKAVFLFFSHTQTREEPVVKITIPLRSSGSEYSRDVLDGLLLSVKESAPKVNTDIFMKVSFLKLLIRDSHVLVIN